MFLEEDIFLLMIEMKFTLFWQSQDLRLKE